MSWRHGLAAGEYPLDDATAKAVLNALAFHASDWSGQCWPSIARLMLWTGLARRSVQNGLRRLEAEGLIKTRLGSNRQASVYELMLPNVGPIDQRHGAADAPHGAAGAPPRAAAAPQSSKNNQEETLTPDWKPSADLLSWAIERAPDADVTLECERFVSVNLASGEEIKNVDQAFRAWILRGIQLSQSRGDRGNRVARVQLEEGTDRLRKLANS